MNKNLSIFISCGEHSGQSHACDIWKSFERSGHKNIIYHGIGGEKMEDIGINIFGNIIKASTVGIFDHIKHIKVHKNALNDTKTFLSKNKIDAAILIDCEGFHLKIINILHSYKIPIFYFVTPQAWMIKFYGPIITRYISKHCAGVFTVFKEEEKYYRRHGVPVYPIPHPVYDRWKDLSGENNNYAPLKKPKIAMLCGSRPNEIKKLVPIFAEAAAILKNKMGKDIDYTTITAEKEHLNYIKREFKKKGILIEEDRNNLKDSKSPPNWSFAWVCSGTISLECALHGIVPIVCYKTSYFNYIMAKILYRYNLIALPNLINMKKIPLVPELVQAKLKPSRLADISCDFLGTPEKIQSLKERMINTLKETPWVQHPDQQSSSLIAVSTIMEWLKNNK